MTSSETDEKLEVTEAAGGEMTSGDSLQDQIDQLLQESAGTAPQTDDAVSATPVVETDKVEVTHVQPELVDPTPPKELALPDTSEIRRILKLQVPMIVRLAEKIMPLGEILQLSPGAIVEFNKNVNEDLDLMINNKSIGSGQAVKVGEKFGLKVTNVTTLELLIRAMAGGK